MPLAATATSCASKREDGKEAWRVNLPTDLQAEINPIGGGPKKLGWGFTWSPMVDGDNLICLPGGPKGTVAALNKRTGKVVWRSDGLTDQAAYTSPMPMTVAGVKQYVVLTNQGLAGVAADDGKVLWSHRRPQPYRTEVVNSPIVAGDRVFVTVGAGQGCECIRVSRAAAAGTFHVESLYSSKAMMNHHGNVVLLDGHLYGHSEGAGWTCIKLETGDTAWSSRGKLPSGAITYADGRFYSVSERDGTVSLINANPMLWSDAGKVRLPKASELRKPKGGFWTPPVVSDGRLYVRDQDLLFCFDIKAKP